MTPIQLLQIITDTTIKKPILVGKAYPIIGGAAILIRHKQRTIAIHLLDDKLYVYHAANIFMRRQDVKTIYLTDPNCLNSLNKVIMCLQ